MKQISCILLCLAILLITPVSATEETGICGDNLTWTVSNGVLTISGYGEMYWYDMGSAPWYPLRQSIRSAVVEEGVASLCYCCFFYLTEMTTVSLPDSLFRMDGMAFYGCRSLPEVQIPAGVHEIGEDAFYGCLSLSAIHVNEANSTFWEDSGVLYEGKKLVCYPAARADARYEIVSGTESVGVCAFSYSPLQELLIPVSVRSFDHTALTDCYSLRSVEVTWGNWFYTAWGGVLFSGNLQTLICYPAQKTGSSYRLPAEVKEIAIRAFAGNPYLQSVEVPGSLRDLGSLAFAGCQALRRAYFYKDAPESVGFNPFPKDVRVFYLIDGTGWSQVDPAGWNVRELQPWADHAVLLSGSGRLTQ